MVTYKTAQTQIKMKVIWKSKRGKFSIYPQNIRPLAEQLCPWSRMTPVVPGGEGFCLTTDPVPPLKQVRQLTANCSDINNN
jgi:hypothetical protein